MPRELVIFDLDNTIYDWYSSFIPAFYGMIDIAADLLNVPVEDLLSEIKNVHVKYSDVEHPYSLLETKTVENFVDRNDKNFSFRYLDPAFHEFNRIRKANLHLYPRTKETLKGVKDRGMTVVAHTDSKFFGALGRLSRLDIVECFDLIYCRQRDESEFTPQISNESRMQSYLHKVVELPSKETKPSEHILERIISNHQSSIYHTTYVGDSLSKDILMAKRVGCRAVWAKYGAKIEPSMFEQLVKISHWTDEDIAAERILRQKSKSIEPDFVCENGIFEVLEFLDFTSLT